MVLLEGHEEGARILEKETIGIALEDDAALGPVIGVAEGIDKGFA